MFEWISANRDWVFSGVGVFVVTSLTSLISVSATIWIKNRSENRKRKRLEATTFFHPYALPRNYKGISNADLKVSYKGAPYENLCLYCVDFRNNGRVAIEKQTAVIQVPNRTDIIDSFEKTNSSLLRYEKHESSSNDFLEMVFIFNRMEAGDDVSLCFVFNFASDIEKPKCSLRGVDNIDYVFRGADFKPELDSDIKYALLLVGAILFADLVPWVGTLLQFLIFILGIPVFTRLASRIANSNQRPSFNYMIRIDGNVDAGSEGTVLIGSGGASQVKTFQVTSPK